MISHKCILDTLMLYWESFVYFVNALSGHIPWGSWKMAAVWQQVLAIDARYNAYRSPNNPQFSEYWT